MVVIDDLSVVIKPDVAKSQQVAETERPTTGAPGEGERPVDGEADGDGAGEATRDAPAATLPRRFFATVEVDADRAARDVGKIAEEVLQHLTVLPKSNVKVTVEIDADIPDGVTEDTQRVVNENCQTLRFKSHGFERS